jgi:hypothetical protein
VCGADLMLRRVQSFGKVRWYKSWWLFVRNEWFASTTHFQRLGWKWMETFLLLFFFVKPDLGTALSSQD